FQYPAMRVGRHEIYWQRPLVAHRDARTGQAQLHADAPLGYLTAYNASTPDPGTAIELWPRLLRREAHVAAVELFRQARTRVPHQDRTDVPQPVDRPRLPGAGPPPPPLRPRAA